MKAFGRPGDREHVRYRAEATPDRMPVGERSREVLPLHVPRPDQLADVGHRRLHLVVQEIRPARIDRRHVGASRELEVLERFIRPHATARAWYRATSVSTIAAWTGSWALPGRIAAR